MTGNPFETRTGKLRERLAAKELDTVLFLDVEGFNWENVYYFSGFRGTSGGFAVTAEDAFLVTDSRYLTQAREQCPFSIVDQGSSTLVKSLVEQLGRRGFTRIGLEGSRIFYRLYRTIEEAGLEVVDVSDFAPSIRRAKDAMERQILQKAADLAGKAFLMTLEKTCAGMTEQAFAALLEYNLRAVGAEGGWGDHDFIVASGPRSALPHGKPTERPFGKGEWVTVDFGARYGGYVSDITRNFSIGPADPWAMEMHDLLVRAHRRAADGLAPGIVGSGADALAREVIDEAGQGHLFCHGLGHGLGLEVHELPRLSSRSTDVLALGDVVTVEPGIYLEGKGGLRLEDDYFIVDGGSERLTSALAQELFEL